MSAESLLLLHHTCLLLAAALLCTAALWDAATFTIPNWISIALIILFIPYALSTPEITWSSVGIHVLVAGLAFAIGLALFAVNVLGGGDVKLITASLFFIGSEDIDRFLLVVALTGGLLSVGAIVLYIIRRRLGYIQGASLRKIHLPYGLALCAGGLAVLVPKINLSVLLAGIGV